MRTVDRPCAITVENGLIKLECDGAVAVFDPSMAELVGKRLRGRAALSRIDDAVRGRIADRLIEQASVAREAIRPAPLRAA